MALFTAENAAINAAKAHEARERNRALRKEQEARETLEKARLSQEAREKIASERDQFAEKLTLALGEKLDALRSATDAKDAAQLAQCLRALRETYHMVTGEPKPGMLKPIVQGKAKRSYTQLPQGWSPPGEEKQVIPVPPPEFA